MRIRRSGSAQVLSRFVQDHVRHADTRKGLRLGWRNPGHAVRAATRSSSRWSSPPFPSLSAPWSGMRSRVSSFAARTPCSWGSCWAERSRHHAQLASVCALRQSRPVRYYSGDDFIYVALNIPFTAWLMDGFFHAIPEELDDAASIDGCSHWGTFWRVALPLALPGAAAASIFAFLTCWNEFAWPASSHARPRAGLFRRRCTSSRVSCSRLAWDDGHGGAHADPGRRIRCRHPAAIDGRTDVGGDEGVSEKSNQGLGD